VRRRAFDALARAERARGGHRARRSAAHASSMAREHHTNVDLIPQKRPQYENGHLTARRGGGGGVTFGRVRPSYACDIER
jgi:hypothetical protein